MTAKPRRPIVHSHDFSGKTTSADLHNHPHSHAHHSHPTAIEAHLAEHRTRIVVAISILTMVAEVGFGYWTRSMALTADGWHMASHAGAMLVTLIAYWFARQKTFRADKRNNVARLYALSGFTSGLMLVGIGISISIESVTRLFYPTTIIFGEAIIVTTIGLVVNFICARLLHIGTEHTDQNLKSAYLHVLADALTSVLALVALLAGKYLNWMWFDPTMGVLGGILVLRWSASLLRDTGVVLLRDDPSPTSK